MSEKLLLNNNASAGGGVKIAEYVISGTSDVLPYFNSGYTYVVEDAILDTGNTLRTIYNEAGVLPTSISFDGQSSIMSVDYVTCSPNTTSFITMFRGCSSCLKFDCSGLNITSNLTDMSKMFYSCGAATEIIFPETMDTSNVTTMESMFYRCRHLTTVDVTKFNTTNVEQMNQMFYNCDLLVSVDVSSFNTTNVNTMSAMFYRCSALTELNLSNFDTTNVNNTNNMFYSCTKLTELNLSNFTTDKVTNMTSMFYGCSGLEYLNIENFSGAKVTNLTSMFRNCSSLITLDLGSFNTTTALKTISYLFRGCSKLQSINLTAFYTGGVTANTQAFTDVPSTASVYVSSRFTLSESNVGFDGTFIEISTAKIPVTAQMIANSINSQFSNVAIEVVSEYQYHVTNAGGWLQGNWKGKFDRGAYMILTPNTTYTIEFGDDSSLTVNGYVFTEDGNGASFTQSVTFTTGDKGRVLLVYYKTGNTTANYTITNS